MENQPDLPEGIPITDLRFVHPERYPLYMAMQGWNALMQQDIDDNPLKIYLSLSRLVPGEITDDALIDLTTRIGMLDEPEIPLSHFGSYTLRKEMVTDDLSRIEFSFRGFPTAHTMRALQVLEAEYIQQTDRTQGTLRALGRKIFHVGTRRHNIEG